MTLNVEKYKLQLEWMDEGTTLFEEAMARLDLSDPRRATLLDSWSVAYLISHVNSNARALINLTVWASTGVVTPMYQSAEQRGKDIETGAAQPMNFLVADFQESAGELSASVRSLSEKSLNALVKSARGRDIPAYEVVWMRIREIWIHAVDLDTGVSFSQFPKELLGHLIDDVVESFKSRGNSPGLDIYAVDAARSWKTVDGEHEAIRVEGAQCDILAWLIGRSNGDSLKHSAATGTIPVLPDWL